MTTDPQNILLINFGQIGDVILSLPAMRAVKERFADSKLTLAIGKSSKAIVEMSGLADEIISVDRVALRDGGKFWAIRQIVRLVQRVRRERFDFVIDLHSLPETNLLGYLSGAKLRLYSNRHTRSLDFLSNFRPRPPADAIDDHISEFYARSLEPLNVKDARTAFQMVPSEEVQTSVNETFAANRIDDGKLIGINIGAGHPTRASNIARFGELAERIQTIGDIAVVAFAGPEEAGLREVFYDHFPENVPLLDRLSLKELTAAFSKLEVVVGNDTGPIHLATAVGTPVVLIIGESNATTFIPLTSELRVVEVSDVFDFDIEKVVDAVRSFTDAE